MTTNQIVKARAMGIADSVELDKRFYVPGVTVAGDCPHCKRIMTQDLGEQYLSYPKVGEPAEVFLSCREPTCPGNRETFTVSVIVRLSVEVAV